MAQRVDATDWAKQKQACNNSLAFNKSRAFAIALGSSSFPTCQLSNIAYAGAKGGLYFICLIQYTVNYNTVMYGIFAALVRTSRPRQSSGQSCSFIRPEQGQSPLQHMYLTRGRQSPSQCALLLNSASLTYYPQKGYITVEQYVAHGHL